jgi:hypothetical protein
MKQYLKTIAIFILFLVFYSITPSCIKEEINLNNVSDSDQRPPAGSNCHMDATTTIVDNRGTNVSGCMDNHQQPYPH